MSIIDEKYRDRYREPDWVGQMINKDATETIMKTVKVKDEEGNVTGEEEVPTKKSKLDLDKLFKICEVNKIDYAKFDEQRDNPNAPGRIRMSVGNMLRAAARRRGGLYDINGDWQLAPAELMDGKEPTETPDGEKIKKSEPESEDA